MKQLGFNNSIIVASVLFLFGTGAILFFTPRTETFQLCFVYFSLYVAFIALYHEVNKIRTAAAIGIFSRCVAWLAFPTLSDDIYRFIWDGSLSLQGVSPYLHLPSEFIANNNYPPFDQLFGLLNSPNYYSVYPTIIQLFSGFGALASNDLYLSSLLIKLPILLAEIGTIWMLPKVLMRLNISPKYSIIYMLNPLMIIDVVGNAHFEAVMIFFTVLSVKLIQDKKLKLAGVSLALAVGTKLIPLLFLPFLLKALPKKEKWHFILGFGALFIVLFSPFLHPEIALNFLSSIRLYLQTFEFNASIYYVARQFSFLIVGYNAIFIIGPALGVSSLGVIAYLFHKQESNDLQSALKSSFWGLMWYLLLATTIHPWYIALLIILGLFTRNFAAVAWSMLIFLSYSAYGNELNKENEIILAIEYGGLAVAMFYSKLTRRLFSSAIQ
ncbi:glycosyltransferase 87 family protein [Salibacteraceae bacterium]|nr:glycosyltransferase 87 family protein [Salibacteraceae bacterium]